MTSVFQNIISGIFISISIIKTEIIENIVVNLYFSTISIHLFGYFFAGSLYKTFLNGEAYKIANADIKNPTIIDKNVTKFEVSVTPIWKINPII